MRHIGHHHADGSEIDLGHEHAFALGRGDRAVPGHNLGARCLCRFGRRGNLVACVVGQHDCAQLLRGGRCHDLDLAGHRVFRGRADEIELAGVRQFLVRFLCAFVGLIEDQNAKEFRQQDHAAVLAGFQFDRIGPGKACPAQHQRGDRAENFGRLHQSPPRFRHVCVPGRFAEGRCRLFPHRPAVFRAGGLPRRNSVPA